ncbi:MAG TPA: flavin reductase family protein [Bryobacteraceae bacterium]|jgi:flavin reductase (DIM6/NTAB) family NADH-FMN oxidoreductase RutF|nr:flavin reductase family protein [Bryobacteraceae bacterium]
MSSKADPGLETWLYRRTCAQFATGITVVTTLDSHGHPHGMTVNSFSSVSLDPPLVLVSIDLRNAILGHFISTSWFAINILAEHQEDLSRRFSSTSENRFVDVDWHPGASGTPLLDGVLAQLECSVVKTFEGGDHTILIGEVRGASYREGRPLVFFDSRYRNLTK